MRRPTLFSAFCSAFRPLRRALVPVLAMGLWACGASVPVWGPEADSKAAEADEQETPPITDVESLAAALKADPALRVDPTAPPEPLPAGVEPGRLVELPAEGPAADPEVLHAWLVDLGVARVQIESLLPEAAPEDARFQGEGDPGILRFRLRPAPPKSP